MVCSLFPFFFEDPLKNYYLPGFSRVDQIPAIIWRWDPNANTGIEMSRWLVVVCGLIFFAFFGFADEAQKHYKIAFDSVAKRVGHTMTTGSTKIGTGITSSTGYVHIFSGRNVEALHYSPSFNKFKGGSSNIASSQGAGMPIYISQEVVEKRDSFDSLSDMTSVKESVYGSEAGSNPSSPFNTLTKTSIARITPGLKPPGPSSPESTYSTSTVETAHCHQISFPASVTPSGSFLDLSTSKEGPGNDNKV